MTASGRTKSERVAGAESSGRKGTDPEDRPDSGDARTAGGEYRRFYESAVEGFFRSTPEGRFLSVNPAFARMLGYSSPEELISAVSDIPRQYYVNAKDRLRYVRMLRERGFVEHFEFKARRKDGAEIWVSNSTRAVYDEKGDIECYEGIVLDITSAKRSEKALAESEERYRLLVSAAPAALFLHDGNTITYANPAACRMLGARDDSELVDRPLLEFVHASYLDEVRKRVETVMVHGQTIPPMEQQYIRLDGGIVDVEARAIPITVQGRRMMYSILHEITDRKRAETALRESERVLSTLLGNLPGMVYRCRNDRNWTMELVSGGCTPLTGYVPADLIGNRRIAYNDIIHPEDRAEVWRQVQESVERRSAFDVTYRIVTAAGEVKWVAERGRGVHADSGELLALEGFIADVTARVLANGVLRENEEKLRKIFHTTPDAVCINRLDDGRYVTVNEGFTRISGYREEAAVGKTSGDLNLWASPGQFAAMGDRLRRYGEVRNLEAAFRIKNGDILYGLISASVIDLNGVPHVLSITRDITERKRMEEALIESEKKFRDLAALLPEVVFETDLTGRFTYANPFGLDLFGYTREELDQGLSALDTISPRDRARAARNIERVLRKAATRSNEYRAVRKNGEEFPVLISSTAIVRDGKTVGMRGLVIDLTERKRLESQLLQAQKLEALGTLSGGIAHDFNNILMGIQGNVSLMMLDLEPHHPHGERLRQVEEHVKTASALTRQLLGIARGGRYEVKPTDMNEIVAKISSMFGRTKKEISIHHKHQEGLWLVEADRGQMEQVFMNLFVNAWQAMPRGGDIFVETENTLLGEETALAGTFRSGRYVKITVADTGIGMDEETRSRAFDPFFTTKEKGTGTGLGLSMVYGIVRGHGGMVQISSEPGHGAVFTLHLPATDKTAAERKIGDPPEMQRGTETILLIDDEESILEVNKAMLEHLGYRVYDVSSGKEGVDLYRAKKDEIDLVILDMIMPGMSGGEVFDRLKEINSGLKALLSSGYSAEGEAASILARGCRGFLQKPFHIVNLSRQVREALR
ncbi:MAG TPA: PAS domain S-box protein [Syntrophales bacterium]|nr:PAS domain S-box protein [Syntrophales bacterium]